LLLHFIWLQSQGSFESNLKQAIEVMKRANSRKSTDSRIIILASSMWQLKNK